MQNNRSDLGDTPYYDYKMVDTDLLLLPAMSHYFLELPQGQGRAKTFLAKKATLQNGTYAQLLDKSAISIQRPSKRIFADTRQQEYPVQRRTGSTFRPKCHVLESDWSARGSACRKLAGQQRGPWLWPVPLRRQRWAVKTTDAGTTLRHPIFPAALVPAALRSISSLASAGIISSAYRNTTSTAQTWEQKAPGLFDVSVNSSTAQSRLQNFVQQANLSTALLQKSGNTTNATEDFYALSLNKDGSPVEVRGLIGISRRAADLVVGSQLRPWVRAPLRHECLLYAPHTGRLCLAALPSRSAHERRHAGCQSSI